MIVDLAVERTALGRACLIVDAAFTARLHVAVGTAEAAEDAWTLAAALDGAPGDRTEGRLQVWSGQQIALGTDVVARWREAWAIRLQNGSWQVGGQLLPYGLYRVGDSSFAGHWEGAATSAAAAPIAQADFSRCRRRR